VRARLAETAEAAPYPLSVSIGVVRCGPAPEYHLDDLLERADQAMYQEKTRRRRGGRETTGTSNDAR
jgi:GGDEF domain-containing protein